MRSPFSSCSGSSQPNLKPLVFLVPELKGTVGLVNGVIKPLMFPGWPTPLSREGNLDALARLITEKVIPFTWNPRWNVRLVASFDSRAGRSVVERFG